ncbi:hypothetical protein N2605_16620 [Bradyrhizobium yuanmingense]|uniref:hypothetical protein n=1 Tax=Bradyrhizobium yuanmingense TaxID=108015 RepID=UPI00114CF21B|nr:MULTISPECIES: hypothetical protein [Bradyrhizobium]MCA1381346.1 hypothetical protein [Bradyrhizobium sp. BRP05]UWU87998.1 hypothetical protein N2605_16620 [Bradyrhizobium sp. CB1024]
MLHLKILRSKQASATGMDRRGRRGTEMRCLETRPKRDRLFKTRSICTPGRLRDARRAQPVYRFEFSAAMNRHS